MMKAFVLVEKKIWAALTEGRNYAEDACHQCCPVGAGRLVRASANDCFLMATFRYTEEEIRQKVSTFRQMLMDKEGVITREGSHSQQV